MSIGGHDAYPSCKLALGCMSDALLAYIRVPGQLLAVFNCWRVGASSSSQGVQCAFVICICLRTGIVCIAAGIFWPGTYRYIYVEMVAGSSQLTWCILQVFCCLVASACTIHELSAFSIISHCFLIAFRIFNWHWKETRDVCSVYGILHFVISELQLTIGIAWLCSSTGRWNTVYFIKQWPTPNVAAKVGLRSLKERQLVKCLTCWRSFM